MATRRAEAPFATPDPERITREAFPSSRKIYVEGSDHPPIYDFLPGVVLEFRNGQVAIPAAEAMAWGKWLAREPPPRELKIGHEWFLESYEIGEETPDTAKKQKEEAES